MMGMEVHRQGPSRQIRYALWESGPLPLSRYVVWALTRHPPLVLSLRVLSCHATWLACHAHVEYMQIYIHHPT